MWVNIWGFFTSDDDRSCVKSPGGGGVNSLTGRWHRNGAACLELGQDGAGYPRSQTDGVTELWGAKVEVADAPGLVLRPRTSGEFRNCVVGRKNISPIDVALPLIMARRDGL